MYASYVLAAYNALKSSFHSCKSCYILNVHAVTYRTRVHKHRGTHPASRRELLRAARCSQRAGCRQTTTQRDTVAHLSDEKWAGWSPVSTLCPRLMLPPPPAPAMFALFSRCGLSFRLFITLLSFYPFLFLSLCSQLVALTGLSFTRTWWPY